MLYRERFLLAVVRQAGSLYPKYRAARDTRKPAYLVQIYFCI